MFAPKFIPLRLLVLLSALCCVLNAPQANAARPMITDDARVVDAKACQLEAWTRLNRDTTELWALPACNVADNLEITLGGAQTREAGQYSTTDVQGQVKTILQPLTDEQWGIGLAVGTLNRPTDLERQSYIYVPVSISLIPERSFLHLNAGVARLPHDRGLEATLGLGLEHQTGQRTWLIAETFRQEAGRPFIQLGVRYWLIPNRMQLDATVGNRSRFSDDERWTSIGIRLLSDRILP
ncbi:MAG: hypothetical protein ACK4FF_08465 [Limnobacter sp.]|uniref:hypothetical protein n=1 Tax=Limnobacter sp. TaxID=2003368 RepID=UPI00391B294B